MWDGHMGRIKPALHRIELIPKYVRAINPVPYPAGGKVRQFEKVEIGHMLKMGAIEPALTEWDATIVFVPKDGSLCFCVN